MEANKGQFQYVKKLGQYFRFSTGKGPLVAKSKFPGGEEFDVDIVKDNDAMDASQVAAAPGFAITKEQYDQA